MVTANPRYYEGVVSFIHHLRYQEFLSIMGTSSFWGVWPRKGERHQKSSKRAFWNEPSGNKRAIGWASGARLLIRVFFIKYSTKRVWRSLGMGEMRRCANHPLSISMESCICSSIECVVFMLCLPIDGLGHAQKNTQMRRRKMIDGWLPTVSEDRALRLWLHVLFIAN